MLKVAFVGGNGHHFLAPAARVGLVEPVAWASDLIDTPASKVAMENKLETPVPWFDDYHKMLDSVDVDVVNVGAVYAYNGDAVLEALRRGLKVVTDKPITAGWEQLRQIENSCTDQTVLLTEFDLRSRPAFRAAQQAVAAGRIGTPVLATAQKSYRFGERRPDFYKLRESYSGTLLWVASHGIDLVHFVTGQRFTQVMGHQGNLARPDYPEMEDHVAVTYALANGGSAVVHADFLRPSTAPTHGDDRIRVIGSSGQVEVRSGQCVLISESEGELDITLEAEGVDVYQQMVEALNGESAIYNTTESLYMAKVLLRSRDAVDSGSILSVDQVAG